MEATIIIIENDDDHKKAMQLVSSLMSASSPGELARLNAQAREVEAYEAQRWPQEQATIPEIIEYLMEQHDLTRDDIAPIFGGLGRVSDVLNGKRSLSINTVKKLRERFGISADIIIPRDEMTVEAAQSRLDELVQEAVDSGLAAPMTQGDWDYIRQGRSSTVA